MKKMTGEEGGKLSHHDAKRMHFNFIASLKISTPLLISDKSLINDNVMRLRMLVALMLALQLKTRL